MNEFISNRAAFTFEGMIIGAILLMYLFPFLGLRSVVGSLIGAVIGCLIGYLFGRRIDLKKHGKEKKKNEQNSFE